MIGSQHTAISAEHRFASRQSASLTATRLWNSRFLSHDEREVLAEAFGPSRSVHANADLVCEGESSDALLIVTEGWACRYTITRDGARQLTALLVPGDVGNLDSLLIEPLHYGVRTLTKAVVIALPRDRALELAVQHPGIARTFTWLALVETTILSKWAQSLGRRTAKERLAHLLCELSVRLGGEHGNKSSFAYPLTQEHVADALGLTSVHLNRTMQALRGHGLIETCQRTITLLDVARLRQIAGFDPRYLQAAVRTSS